MYEQTQQSNEKLVTKTISCVGIEGALTSRTWILHVPLLQPLDYKIGPLLRPSIFSLKQPIALYLGLALDLLAIKT